MILLTGGAGYTGRRVLPRLRALGEPLRLLLRPETVAEGLTRPGDEIVRGDLAHPGDVSRACAGVDVLLHLAHIRYGSTLVAGAGGSLRHAVLVSSTWRHSKIASPAVDEVVAGEAAVANSDLPWTVLRPTMIYGGGDDRNISRLVAHIRRHGWVPVFGSGEELHQPVFVDDVVDACIHCVGLPQPTRQAFDLGGAAPLTNNELISSVARVLGRRVRKLHLPVGPTAWALSTIERLGLQLPISGEQVRRSGESRACDISAARAQLKFEPVTFEEGLDRVYGNEAAAGGRCEPV